MNADDRDEKAEALQGPNQADRPKFSMVQSRAYPLAAMGMSTSWRSGHVHPVARVDLPSLRTTACSVAIPGPSDSQDDPSPSRAFLACRCRVRLWRWVRVNGRSDPAPGAPPPRVSHVGLGSKTGRVSTHPCNYYGSWGMCTVGCAIQLKGTVSELRSFNGHFNHISLCNFWNLYINLFVL